MRILFGNPTTLEEGPLYLCYHTSVTTAPSFPYEKGDEFFFVENGHWTLVKRGDKFFCADTQQEVGPVQELIREANGRKWLGEDYNAEIAYALALYKRNLRLNEQNQTANPRAA